MQYVFFLPLFLLTATISAQNKDRAFSFHMELEGMVTRSTMLADLEDMSSRFDFAGGLTVAARHPVSASFGLEAGVGFRYLTLRQRYAGPRFACDRPAILGGAGQQTYLDSEVGNAYFTVPLAALYHLYGTKDGPYLKPKLTLMLELSNSSRSLIYECGEDNTFSAVTEDYSIVPISLLPGLGIGYQFEGVKWRTSYLEFNLAMATGKIINGGETRPTSSTGVLFDSGVMMAGISIGWQIDGKKKDRRPKKQQPALIPGYSTF
jgi:hypothetical protein